MVGCLSVDRGRLVCEQRDLGERGLLVGCAGGTGLFLCGHCVAGRELAAVLQGSVLYSWGMVGS
jgi:hypothetical protein